MVDEITYKHFRIFKSSGKTTKDCYIKRRWLIFIRMNIPFSKLNISSLYISRGFIEFPISKVNNSSINFDLGNRKFQFFNSPRKRKKIVERERVFRIIYPLLHNGWHMRSLSNFKMQIRLSEYTKWQIHWSMFVFLLLSQEECLKEFFESLFLFFLKPWVTMTVFLNIFSLSLLFETEFNSTKWNARL